MDIEALEAEIRKNPDAKINDQTFKSRALHQALLKMNDIGYIKWVQKPLQHSEECFYLNIK